ncbi:AAA family ATPase [Mycolicibacterium sp. S3B2]|uniref:AAA family ATPase n=1 Tax=Mycolicibacterium sp. S3B2 TaxID=3415120 RepID=UPI003C7DCBA1
MEASPSQRQAYAKAALEDELRTLSSAVEGTRNHQLFVSAAALRRFVREGDLGEAQVEGLLTQTAQAIGLTDAEIEKTIASARRKDDASDNKVILRDTDDWARPAYQLDAADDPLCAGGCDATEAGAEAARESFVFTSGGAFIFDGGRRVTPLWGVDDDVLWAEGESLMIAGAMGLGKTTLLGLLVREQLGLGEGHLLGFPVQPIDGPILVLAMDRPRQAARAMLRQFDESDRAVLDERLKVWPAPPPMDLAANTDILLELARDAGAAVVYLDSLKDAAVGLSEDEVGARYGRARQKLLADGRQLCELHHTTKRNPNGGPPREVTDIYGSTWLTNGTGSILLLTGEPGDPIIDCRHVRQPVHEVGPLTLLHDQDAGQITIHRRADLVELAAAAGPDGVTARTAAVALFGAAEENFSPTRAQVEKAKRRLDKLVPDFLERIDGSPGGESKRPTVWFPANRLEAL